MLKIEHLTRQYPGTEKGIFDLSLHVFPGDLYAFIGHNGAGKTTTLKAIAGIHAPDAGEITVDGVKLSEDPMECRRRMAYIPDNPDLYSYLTGNQYLDFVADVFDISDGDRRERITKYADAFELSASLGDLISSYSHGMKQKLAIISAFLHEPRLLILDEPFVGLDPFAAARLKEMMRALCAAGGAVFFSTHVLEVAEKLCNKVAVIKNGRLVVAGEMQEVIGDGKNLESIFLEVVSDVE